MVVNVSVIAESVDVVVTTLVLKIVDVEVAGVITIDGVEVDTITTTLGMRVLVNLVVGTASLRDEVET